MFTIIDKATRNFEQTSMLCLNHVINWAYNADKSGISVRRRLSLSL